MSLRNFMTMRALVLVALIAGLLAGYYFGYDHGYEDAVRVLEIGR